MDNIIVHFKGEEEFVKRMLSIIDHVSVQQTFYLSGFLSPYHQSIVKALIGRNSDLKAEFYGGIENAEMQRCLIAPSYFSLNLEDYEICVFEVLYPSKFETLKHSDILGALMALGVKRELFGDIVIHEGIYFACDKQVSRLLEMDFKSAGRAKVHLKETDQTITSQIDYQIKTFFVRSFRLDVLLATFYRLSRNEVNRYIQAGFVKVNHKEVVENNFLCNNNDVISFKRHGRVKLVDSMRLTKQGNHVVEGYFYK